jgi:hypothetical protein
MFMFKPKPMKRAPKRFLAISVLAAALALPSAAAAGGRYERGRTLYRLHCAVCLGLWQWAPTRIDPRRPPDLQKMAKDWTAGRVCTWMRKKSRKTQGRGCYPGRVSARDRLDMLYYVYRRAQGPIRKPRLRQSRLKLYRGPTLKRTLQSLRRTALQRFRNRMLLRRMRERARRRRPGKRVTPRHRRRPATRRNRGQR